MACYKLKDFSLIVIFTVLLGCFGTIAYAVDVCTADKTACNICINSYTAQATSEASKAKAKALCEKQNPGCIGMKTNCPN